MHQPLESAQVVNDKAFSFGARRLCAAASI
jgi:hypothetical protein